MRTAVERKAHALDRLEHEIDVWVATASAEGKPYLVPLSLGWDGVQVIAATPAAAVTARNLAARPIARLAVGDSRDVVMIDARARTVPAAEAEEAIMASYVARTGWDPREEHEAFVMILLAPTRIQVWRSVEEIEGRDVMKGGAWLV